MWVTMKLQLPMSLALVSGKPHFKNNHCYFLSPGCSSPSSLFTVSPSAVAMLAPTLLLIPLLLTFFLASGTPLVFSWSHLFQVCARVAQSSVTLGNSGTISAV